MAVKVMVKRVPQPGVWANMNMVLREMRLLGLSQPGYISGETMLSAADRGTTLVISTWAHLNNWKAYEALPQRRELLDKLEPLLAEPATMEVWIESPVIG